MYTVLTGLIAALALACFSSAAWAFPDKPLRLVVPFPPGGGTDVVARILARKLAESLGQAIIVDNRAGAGGTIGVAYTAKEKGDGYTLVQVSALAHTASANLYPGLAYDAVKSFTAIGLIGSVPYLLIVNPKFPAANYADFVKTVRAAPGKYNGASAGSGSAPHLALELFKRTVGLDIVHVPYKGSAQALLDLIGGEVDLEFENVAAAQHIKAGKLRALAVTGKHRMVAFPDLPTFSELGQPDFDVTGYWGLLGPAGIPADVVAVLNRALSSAVKDPAIRAQLDAQGLEAEASTAEEFAAIVRSEADKWSRVIREANIKQ